MKKTLKLITALVLVASMAICMTSCDTIMGIINGFLNQPEVAAQGIDTENHVIHVGNTAATSGAFAAVGVPFNYAQEAYFWYYTTQTDGYVDADGNKYTIEMHHYDDGFDGVKALPLRI